VAYSEFKGLWSGDGTEEDLDEKATIECAGAHVDQRREPINLAIECSIGTPDWCCLGAKGRGKGACLGAGVCGQGRSKVIEEAPTSYTVEAQ
jgi:hypothetical protein